MSTGMGTPTSRWDSRIAPRARSAAGACTCSAARGWRGVRGPSEQGLIAEAFLAFNRARMDPLKIYDYLVRARARVFDWVRPLAAEDYAREFRPRERTVGQMLTHTMLSEWVYLRRIQRLPLPPEEQWPVREEPPPPFAVLEAAWIAQG